MNIVGVIPARYQSTRFPGKPLADICGKPMIWWVYNQVKKVEALSEVYVATDDERIKTECEKYNIKVVMTKDNHPNHIARIHEVSEIIKADLYVCINGDEPLIDDKSISMVVQQAQREKSFFTGAYRILKDPVETLDSGNIKIITNLDDDVVYMSRTPVPFPKGTLLFQYKKYVGIECFTKESLDFFVNTKMGEIEKIEDIDHLRFIENHKILKFRKVDSESLSVDTPKDLEKVREILKTSQNIKISGGVTLYSLYSERFGGRVAA